MSSAGLPALAAATHLRSLDVTLDSVEDEAIASLAQLTNLKRLDLRLAWQATGGISDAAAASLEKLTALEELSLPTKRLSDAGLTRLASLKGLKQLSLTGGQFSGAGLAGIEPRQELTSLSLSGSSFGDEGVQLLPKIFPGLRSLNLGATPITDAALSAIAGLPQLRSLNLGQTKITDAALPAIARLPQLTSLDLSATQVTGAGLPALAGLSRLTDLDLDGTKIGDEGAAALARLVTLVELHIEGTKITDAGLAKLKALENLRVLYIERTETTKQGVALLRKAMPRTYVRDGHDEESGLVRYYDPVGSASWSLDDPDPAGQQQPEPKVDLPSAAGAAAKKPATSTAADKPAAEVSEPPSGQSPAGQKALDKLKELGAKWHVSQPWPGVAPKGALAYQLVISFGDEWQGTAEDWKLLEAVDDPEHLHLGLVTDRLEGLSQVKLTAPLAQISLRISSAERLAKLDHMPPCRRLFLQEEFLTLADYRKLISLAPDVEDLHLQVQNPRGIFSGDELADVVAGGMKKLKHLNFGGLPVTGKGLAALSTLGGLEELWLSIAGIAPAEVQPLSRLTHLRWLYIATSGAHTKEFRDRANEVPLGDAIASAVAGTPSLRAALVNVLMGDAGAVAISQAGNLKLLDLAFEEVTDGHLAALGQLTTLRRLHLKGRGRISDVGLASLAGLTRLTDLALPADELTDTGLAQFGAASGTQNTQVDRRPVQRQRPGGARSTGERSLARAG